MERQTQTEKGATMNLEYGYTKYQNEIGRDGKEYRLAIRIRRIDNRVLDIRIDEVI